MLDSTEGKKTRKAARHLLTIADTRCQKERDQQIELVLEKLDKEREIELAQTQKNGRSKLQEVLREKKELIQKLRDQETQFNLTRKDLLEVHCIYNKEWQQSN